MTLTAEQILAQLAADINHGLIPADARRPLTAKERRAAINFVHVDTATTAVTRDVAATLLEMRDRWLERLATELGSAARRYTPDVANARLHLLGLYGANVLDGTEQMVNGAARHIRPLLRTAATRGVEHVTAEAARQGLVLPTIALPADAAAYAEHVAGALARDAVERAARVMSGLTLPPDVALEDAVAMIRRHLELVPSRGVHTDLARVPVEQSYGLGRLGAAEAGPSPAAVYASELRDKATCWACEAIDGTEYSSVQQARIDYSPTYRACAGDQRCRGTLVFIYEGEDPLLA